MHMCANYFSCIHVFAILWTVARQTLSIGQSIETFKIKKAKYVNRYQE